MSTIRYIDIGFNEKQVYAVDTSRLEPGTLRTLETRIGFVEDEPSAPEVPNSFYELAKVFGESSLQVPFLQRETILRLFVKGQVPYTPEELSAVLADLKEINDVVGESVAICPQIFIGKSVANLAHAIKEGYRTYDISEVSVESLVDSPLQFAVGDKDIYDTLCYCFQIKHSHSIKSVIDNKTDKTYQEIMAGTLEDIVNGNRLYVLGEVLSKSDFNKNPWSVPTDLSFLFNR